MKPETFASLVSALLYEKRLGPYFCQPVIAGLGDDDKPFICTMDAIGAKELAKDFVVAGSASKSLYGACEAMFKPDMEPEELFETVSQALQASVDRDCLLVCFFWELRLLAVPSIGFSRRWDPIPSFTSQQSMQVDL